MTYVLGLDWAGGNCWAYCKLSVKGGESLKVGRLPVEGAPDCELLTGATKVVVDAPIGLPNCDKSAQLRACDRGARKWVGDGLGQTIQPVMSQVELEHWRAKPGDRKGGHLRGLLPAISSAAHLAEAGIFILESHPELVFTALAGRPLARDLRKKTLQGVLVRLDLLRQHDIDLSLAEAGDRHLVVDDVLDAGAMVLVALGWEQSERSQRDLQVIRSKDGETVPLRQGRRDFLMALPMGFEDSRECQEEISGLNDLNPAES